MKWTHDAPFTVVAAWYGYNVFVVTARAVLKSIHSACGSDRIFLLHVRVSSAIGSACALTRKAGGNRSKKSIQM